MTNDVGNKDKIYSLIPLEDFKVLLGVDDREDKMSCFCLVAATMTIEQYCKRRLMLKRHSEFHGYAGDYVFTIGEYPVQKIHSVQSQRSNEKLEMINWKTLEPEQYYCVPDTGIDENFPFTLVLRPPLRNINIKICYTGGYLTNEKLEMKNEKWMNEETINEKLKMQNEELEGRNENVITVPADLASACMELAIWNMNRYRGRRIGMTGNIRGGGKDGEHFEMSMPENVRELIEPYKRKVI